MDLRQAVNFRPQAQQGLKIVVQGRKYIYVPARIECHWH